MKCENVRVWKYESFGIYKIYEAPAGAFIFSRSPDEKTD
jgi:hypothetical protein